MPTLPLKVGGTTITVQTSVQNPRGDHTYTDRVTIPGCLMFPSFSVTGRISTRSESNAGGADVVTDNRTVYAPFGSDVRATDRVLIHPDGMATIDPADTALRKRIAYQVLGEPMQWKNALTGWTPACEIALNRVT
jgi:hypothetical protein